MAESPLTLCVCSAHPTRVAAGFGAWRAAVDDSDELLVIYDTPTVVAAPWSGTTVNGPGVRVGAVWQGAARGLSAARMTALEIARSRYVVFIDDDVVVPGATVESIRAAFVGGAHAVGVRLEAGFEACRRPWYLPDGVLHYVGVHSKTTLGSVWGACLAVDREFARVNGIVFREELGRRGRKLLSGEDSALVRGIRECGGSVVFLSHVSATHHVSREKCTFRYLIRRAWWQGRTEVRRGEMRRGLGKEVGRIQSGGSALVRLIVTPIFVSAVIAGMATELTVGRRSESSRERCGTPAKGSA